MLCAHCKTLVPAGQRADVRLEGWPWIHSTMHVGCAHLFASRWPVTWPDGTFTIPEPADQAITDEIEQQVAFKRAEVAAWDIAPLPPVERHGVRLVRAGWAS